MIQLVLHVTGHKPYDLVFQILHCLKIIIIQLL
jgi:hypothetical protein